MQHLTSERNIYVRVIILIFWLHFKQKKVGWKTDKIM
jgi:hypothetical protein